MSIGRILACYTAVGLLGVPYIALANDEGKSFAIQIVDSTLSAAESCHTLSRLFSKVSQEAQAGATLSRIKAVINNDALNAEGEVVEEGFAFRGDPEAGAQRYFENCIAERRTKLTSVLTR